MIPHMMMCLSLKSDDLSIEAPDLSMNLLLEEPWALSSEHCQDSDLASTSFRSDLTHWTLLAAHGALHIGKCTEHCTSQITHWTLHCTLQVEHFDPGATSSDGKHWTLPSPYWTLNILICVQDQMFHTLVWRSNSNHITCCKFAPTDQRETQRGTWGESRGTDVRLVRSKTR